MNVKEFEALKKKQEELQLWKAKEEAKLESLERELEGYKKQLSDLGITDLDNAESVLEQKELELQTQYEEISNLLSQLEK
jgi:chromosome segregation ATPase